ncbi:restriction endonuclease subunit S [Alloalcanivorax gelatiniphagus]|uniref:Restriction endonuclease subunit S n=1 Tax=Alloalcanivorax gelatiniphagus TaxID=1194167 RepID=A0ABY2XQP2_9GAMM|nr:restriction endonuclease subunit S [Alloalcanivorax gelatiniphagus]TMW15210.1 restriction endonuclease subunit S [Alloalcanivorax gelatiniphagus]
MSRGRLSELVEFNPKRPLKKESLAPFVDMASLPESSRDISSVSKREFKGGGARFIDGDTLFARITPCLENGKTAKVSGLGHGVVGHGSTEFIVMAAKDPTVDEDFIYYLARTPEFRAYAQARMEGTSGRQRVSWQSLSDFELEIPDANVRKLAGDILRAFDDKIQVNRKINETLEKVAQAIFKSWFVDFEPVKARMATLEAGGSEEDSVRAAMQSIAGKTNDQLARLQVDLPKQHADLRAIAQLFPSAIKNSELGDIPEGWQVTTFGEVSTCMDKHRIPLSKIQREKKKGSIPYFGATSIMDYVDEYIFDGVYLLIGEDGSVLKESGAPFTQYVWGKMWVNNHAHVIQGVSPVSTEQLLLFIKNKNIAPYVTGAVQLKLNQKNMNSIPFIRAGRGVCEAFDEIAKPIFEEIRNRYDESYVLARTRDSLLPQILSGVRVFK